MTTSKGDGRLRAWIQRVPSDAVKIVVAWDNLESLSIVGEWSKEEAAGTDAVSLILDAAQDHCDATEYAQRYVIAWCDKSDKQLASRPIKLAPEDTDDDDDGQAPFGAVKVDPSQQGVIGHLLKNSENMHRMFFAAQAGLVKGYRELNAAQAHEIGELRKRVRVSERAAQAADTNADDASEAEDSAMLERVGDRMFTLLEALIADKAQPGNGNNGTGH